MLEFESYLDRLSSNAPTPGGGSAATLVGALGAGLVAMVARITERSAAHAAVHAEARALAGDVDGLRVRFLAARPLDEAAYEAVVAAQALPRGSDAERARRTEVLQAALAGAAEAPLAVAALAAALFEAAVRAAELRNTHLASDVECALRFARAAFDASAANVRINHRFLTQDEVLADQDRRLEALRERARAHEDAALQRLAAG